MPNIAKEEKVRTIKADLEKATAVWVVDYRGLTVKESEQLRGAIREADAQLKVLKNTLTQRALAELELPTMDEILAGPSAFVFTNGDPVAAAKTLKKFGKENKNLVIKGGQRRPGPGHRRAAEPRGAHRQAAGHAAEPDDGSGACAQRPDGVVRPRGRRHQGPEGRLTAPVLRKACAARCCA